MQIRITLVIVTCLIALGAVTDTGPLLLGGGDAHAVIGRPLTPVSYAGVARRTTRRAAYAGTYANVAAPAVVVPTSAVVTTLPTSCTQGSVDGSVVYECGGVTYRPYYHGPTVVYETL